VEALGTHASRWPARLRDQIVGRAVGRALAHEIGHFVLRSPHHGKAGLMRAEQRASALVSPDRKPFGLARVDEARLQIALDALPPAVPVRAGAPGDRAFVTHARLAAPEDGEELRGSGGQEPPGR
jgi:hypothetical protein